MPAKFNCRPSKRALAMRGLSHAAFALLMGGLAIGGTGHAATITASDVDKGEVSEKILPEVDANDPALASLAVSHWKLAESAAPAPSGLAYGPPPPESLPSAQRDRRYASFGSQIGAVKWEVGAIFAYITVSQIIVTKEVESFHFQDEGWFGKSTENLGVDKLTHAFNSYVIAEFLQARIRRKSGGAAQGATTAAVLATGLMAWSELFDAHKTSSGWSNQDLIANIAGAGFSVVRNSVPGMKQKLDFRLLVTPNSDVYTLKGKEHYAQQRFFLALQLAGFSQLEHGPLRLIELHAGYHAKGFTARERARGDPLQRRIFYGIGLNLNELFFKRPRSRVARAASSVLDYIQPPYTAVHFH